MEFLDKLVLPHSGDNLNMLRYLLLLALLLFEIFAGALLGSAVLSLFFARKARITGKETFHRLALNYIDLITMKRSMGIGLGIVPFASIILIFVQLLHGASNVIVSQLVISFVLFCAALVLLNFYRHTSHLNGIFSFFKSKDALESNAFFEQNFREISAEAESFNKKASFWGVVLLIISMWIFIGSLAISTDANKWNVSNSLFHILFSFGSVIKFVHFLTASFAIASIAFIVKYFYWDKPGNMNEEFSDYARKLNTYIALIFTAVQPVLFVFNIMTMQKQVLSVLPFAFMLIAAVLSFILIRMLYSNLKENNYNATTVAFYIFIAIFGLFIFKEQSYFGIASKDHIHLLSEKYEKVQVELASARVETADVNGMEVYKKKCAACHQFDEKLVGPPHKQVLIKYQSNKDALTKFILNPVKVDPEYPAMPNMGLTPREAKAVVEYMFEEYGGRLK